MRTILQIIETAKDGQHIEKDEAYWTMLALDILLADEQQALSTVSAAIMNGKKIATTASQQQKASFDRLTMAANMEPETLVKRVGRDPNSPEYQEKRKAMKEALRKQFEASGAKKKVDGEPSLN